ncbi:MAG: hypothetical protein ACRDGE_12290 [Candidatus Limnocylindria bacterium]
MEYTILALVLVVLVTIFIAWLVMAGVRRGGGPPDGQNGRRDRNDAAEQRPPEGEPEIETESEKLANRPR